MNRVVYEVVAERAAGRCEGCFHAFGLSLKDRPELDHFEGRARSESVETCWMLCGSCHAGKSANDPSKAYWLARFAIHAEKYGYRVALVAALKRLEFDLVRLGVSP